VIDLDGVEWLPALQVADRLAVSVRLVYRWRATGRVRAHDIRGLGLALHMGDAMTAEQAWRRRRKGHPRRAEIASVGQGQAR
jgi:hypothetical protein